jgi:hypothetical protein
MESPILTRIPSDTGHTSTGTANSHPRSRQRRSRSRHRLPKEPDLSKSQDFDFLANLNAAAASSPTLASQLQALSFGQGEDMRVPSGSSSSTFEIPYTSPQAMTQQHHQQSKKGSRPRKQKGGPMEKTPVVEHPVQVPVRVVNPDLLSDQYIPGRGASDPGKGSQGNLRLRLDLNLDVEITLKAKIRGDLTLALL